MARHLIIVLDLYGVDRDRIEPLGLIKGHDLIAACLTVVLMIYACQVLDLLDILVFLDPAVILLVKDQDASGRWLPLPLQCGSLLLRDLLALHGSHHHGVSIRALKVIQLLDLRDKR
jgi:hypothetical protein